MNIWNLLLVTLLQSPIEPSAGPVHLRDESRPVSSETVPLGRLKERVATGEFLPMPSSILKDLNSHQSDSAVPDQAALRPQIREARFSATLNGTRLDSGTLLFDVYQDRGTSNTEPLLLGSTSLQQLTIADEQGSIPLGADSARRLFLLRPGLPENLTGTWTADGLITGDVVTFRLELPPATTSRLELITGSQIQVTGTGCLVIGPEASGDLQKWTLIPGDTSRLTFSCRRQPNLSPQDPLPLSELSASHTLSADVFASRWTIGLPSDLRRKTTLSARVSRGVRIADVLLDDRRPVEWSVAEENGQQILKLGLPELSSSAILTVSAVTVLPQSETWELPMLSLTQWQNENGQQRGPILMPVSQISVHLPASVELDEWILAGIQERDVVTGPDQSHEYQLIQFLPEASAIVRTSTSQPRISDSVVTLVEPAGRLATVRCLVNVRCEGSAVVELQWPVTVGWQVIAARYASNSRALFFESPHEVLTAGTMPLTVHLPESLEPGSSRVFEIQLQQSDTSDPRTLNPPLQARPGTSRTNDIVIFPPAFSLSSDLQRYWSAGRKPLTSDEVRRRMPWFPESRVKAGMQAFDASHSGAPGNPPDSGSASPLSDTVRLEHAIRIEDGLIVESSRIVLPADSLPEQSLSVLVASAANADMRWSLDGEPVAAKREDDSDPEWRKWAVPLRSGQPGIPRVILCESRRQADPEFTACIPVPKCELPVNGTLQLFSSDENLLSVEQLKPEYAASPTEQSSVWRLPVNLQPIHVRIEQNPRIQSGQTIDVQMLHLVEEHNGRLQQEILAVASISRSAGRTTLPLSLTGQFRPLVMVNGHRVQLQETAGGLSIPLPPSTADSQVLLIWTEPADQPENPIRALRLPRLFLRELAVPQCPHHVLVDPMLELEAPATSFAATESTDILLILDRLPGMTAAGSGTAAPTIPQSLPAEVRRFVARWQLGMVHGWNSRTVIDAVASEAPIVVQISQVRRRVAAASGVFLLSVAVCVALRRFFDRYSPVAASVALGLLGLSFLVPSLLLSDALRGAFWGLGTGLLLILVSRWRWIRAIGRLSILRPAASVVALLLMSSCPAMPQSAVEADPSDSSGGTGLSTEPDVLIPETPVPGSDVVYVRRRIIDAWKLRQSTQQSASPQAVVTSLNSRIVSESADSIELQLTLGVAVVTSDEDAMLRIPLQGSRLVECTVDGMKVFPEPDGEDSIRVPVPASTLLQSTPLDTDISKESETTAGDEQSTAVQAGPRAAFTLHTIECRLRPVSVRQKSGVQFRLPGLPCPVATVEVTAPAGLYSSARAQTSAGVVHWNPADGVIPLDSLAMSDGIDVRLFQAGIDQENPTLPSVAMLAINETVSGQQILTCVCQFSKWNLLAPEIRYRIPQGYSLVGVSASSGADMVTDLLWSVREQMAVVQLPGGMKSEFVLSLQLKSRGPVAVQNQTIPVAELQQFQDCIVTPGFLLAVRANPVFSVLPLEGDNTSAVAITDLQTDWGQWLRRSDSVFRVPGRNQNCVVRLTPRSSINEVRIAQAVSILEGRIDWNCRLDIETTVLPVFRHRIAVSSEIAVTDVQVVAGEANRLASWHRRGDQLIIQLKEGTRGLHGITISGRQILRPDDTSLTLHSPHLQNAQILESSMTIVDQDGLGLTFVKLGGAVPDERIKPDDVLAPGTSVRMQIVNEADPIVLRRIRPVDPVGFIAAIRSASQITFLMRVTQWSGSLGPLHMEFADSAAFLTEPVVFAEGQQLPLIREANEFVASQDVVRSLFDKPEFTVVWTMPVEETGVPVRTAAFAWPQIFEDILWKELLLVPLDVATGSSEDPVDTVPLPAWLTEAVSRATGRDLPALKAKAVTLSVADSLSEQQLTIPVLAAPSRPAPKTSQGHFAISDSVVWSNPNQSAVGETLLLIFAARTPSKCSVTIPDGTVVTEIQSAAPTRWEDSAHRNVMVELTGPVTTIKARWLSERATGFLLSTEVGIVPPFPADCDTRRTLTVMSADAERPQFPDFAQLLSPADLTETQVRDIDAGLNYAQSSETESSATTAGPPPSRDLLVQTMNQFRSDFRNRTGTSPVSPESVAVCRPAGPEEIRVSIRRHAGMSTIVSISAGLIVLMVAFGRKLISESVPQQGMSPLLQPTATPERSATLSPQSVHASGVGTTGTGEIVPLPPADERAPSSVGQSSRKHT